MYGNHMCQWKPMWNHSWSSEECKLLKSHHQERKPIVTYCITRTLPDENRMRLPQLQISEGKTSSNFAFWRQRPFWFKKWKWGGYLQQVSDLGVMHWCEKWLCDHQRSLLMVCVFVVSFICKFNNVIDLLAFWGDIHEFCRRILIS